LEVIAVAARLGNCTATPADLEAAERMLMTLVSCLPVAA
jgi:hypothetical protein